MIRENVHMEDGKSYRAKTYKIIAVESVIRISHIIGPNNCRNMSDICIM